MQLVVITKPEIIKDEAEKINSLFRNGMQTLHLRKPKVSVSRIERLLSEINSAYYKQIVIHDHFVLAERFHLKGVHLTYRTKHHTEDKLQGYTKSIGCHSYEELERVSNKVDYTFLSPIFDSISKKDYKSSFNFDEIAEKIKTIEIPVIALGGISLRNIGSLKEFGFTGAAVLGTLWNEENILIDQFLKLKSAIEQ